MRSIFRAIYRYFKFYRHEEYVSSEWLHELESGQKEGLIAR